MQTPFESIVSIGDIGGSINPITLNELLPLAALEDLTPAKEDSEKVLLLMIDYQKDFMENGSLGVPGSHGDIERATRWFYENAAKITKTIVSIDTHQPFQIFFPSWWIDEDGNAPAPLTAITLADLDSGKWRATRYPLDSRTYVQELEKSGKKVLVIWPYHCIDGTTGHSLENQLTNMIFWHGVARKYVVRRLKKGQDPLSEMYGIFKPEYSKKGKIDMTILNQMVEFDKIVIAGEAKSHCVLESIAQLLSHYQSNLDVTKKVFILEDTMSVIPSFEDATQLAFEEFVKTYKVNMVTTQTFKL